MYIGYVIRSCAERPPNGVIGYPIKRCGASFSAIAEKFACFMLIKSVCGVHHVRAVWNERNGDERPLRGRGIVIRGEDAKPRRYPIDSHHIRTPARSNQCLERDGRGKRGGRGFAAGIKRARYVRIARVIGIPLGLVAAILQLSVRTANRKRKALPLVQSEAIVLLPLRYGAFA